MNKCVKCIYILIFILIGYSGCSDKSDDLHTGPIASCDSDEDNFDVGQSNEEESTQTPQPQPIPVPSPHPQPQPITQPPPQPYGPYQPPPTHPQPVTYPGYPQYYPGYQPYQPTQPVPQYYPVYDASPSQPPSYQLPLPQPQPPYYPGYYQPYPPYQPYQIPPTEPYQQYQGYLPYQPYHHPTQPYQPEQPTTEESKDKESKKFKKCETIGFLKMNEEGNLVPMTNEDYIESFPNNKTSKYVFKSNLEKLYCNDKIIYTHKIGKDYCTSLTYNNKTNCFIMTTPSGFYLIKYYKGKWETIEKKIHKYIKLYGIDESGMPITIDENFYYTDFLRPNTFKYVFLPGVKITNIDAGTKTIWKKGKKEQFPIGLSFSSFNNIVLHFDEYVKIFRMFDGEYRLHFTKNK
ncbi:Theileria-specific sub-telomeric protein, SVSP family, putative [Theileria annulata]|uniref:Theileria-specific sub-telomeric protein, SVSP family, putative n=1 Tax=Theileria annulata TaxID=5874 RepID=Q4UFT6_THEAN|nr:Theileria-specific sub-telomeric protein, SVSP family, putative [Theileria annulata]CAI74030.1 Theileria-specific sub-telomeric protein, SVSP family, putative [Theileria annulata]|eukprot:XP_951762.1 Theileria-specific sub-telomeric protein, SVSP family, putative [Theileria annulata]